MDQAKTSVSEVTTHGLLTVSIPKARSSGDPLLGPYTMKDEATLRRIVASVYDAAPDPERWPGFSAIADESLGVRRTRLLCGDGESNEDARSAFQWTYERRQHRDDIENLYFGTYDAMDECVPRLRPAPVGQLLHNTDLFTDGELKTSPIYHAIKTQECADAVNLRLDGPGGLRIHWFSHDPVERDGWTSARLDSFLSPSFRFPLIVSTSKLLLSYIVTVLHDKSHKFLFRNVVIRSDITSSTGQVPSRRTRSYDVPVIRFGHDLKIAGVSTTPESRKMQTDTDDA